MGQAAIDPLDALAAQHGATVPASEPAAATADPLDALAEAHGALPTFRSSTADAPEPDWIDKLTGWLPAIGGTVGGIVGGIGGTVAGVGVGGVPGAIGGAALGGEAGEAYKQLINRARGRQVPTTMSDAATDIGKEAVTQGGAEAVGAAVAPVTRAIGARMMQSAVKPGMKALIASVRAGEPVPRVVQTLLDEGVNVTPGGIAKLQALIKSTNQDITDAVSNISARISPLKVAGRLSDTAKKFMVQANPQADLEAISDAGQNFLNHPMFAGKTLSPAESQALKVGTYARIGEKYGKVGAAGVEAEKALARGLKEELATESLAQGVDLTQLNAREGRLLEALDATGKRVALAGNKDPIGFAWAAHNPTTFLAALIDKSPAIKSLVARGLYNHAGVIAKVPPALIRAAVHSMASDDPQAALDATSTDQGNPR